MQFNSNDHLSRTREFHRILCGTVLTGRQTVAPQDRQGGGGDERRPRRTPSAGGARGNPRDRRGAPRTSGPNRARTSQPRPQGDGDQGARQVLPSPPTSTPDSWHRRSAASSPRSTRPPPTTSHATSSPRVTCWTRIPKPRSHMPRPPGRDPGGSRRYVRPSVSRRITAATGRRRSLNCVRPAEWAAAHRCWRSSPTANVASDAPSGRSNWRAPPRPNNSPATTPTNCASWWRAHAPISASSSRRSRSCRRRALDPTRTGQTAARLFYAYAETLLALGRHDEALQGFLKAAAADVEGVTDAEDRITELA